MDAGAPVRFTDPTVLLHSPYRVTFAYAGSDDSWLPAWHGAAFLPARIRVTVRDAITQQKLAVSTAALVHVDTPAECVRAQNANQCMTQIAQAVANANKTPAATEPRGDGL
jgi:general secretion pathway protein J